ncbi:MAG: potassium channel family protein, partial [Burkholderiales bacterium]
MLEMLTLLGITVVVVAIVVMVHYEFLYFLTTWKPRLYLHGRIRFVMRVVGALVAHTVEVWIFALAYYFLLDIPRWGTLKGNFDGSLWDCVYFSFITFTTVGYGDIQPEGVIRHLVGFEALTGLLLVTWTASFLYRAM